MNQPAMLLTKNSPYENLVGNEPIKEFLLRIVHNKNVGQSYLFAGSEGVGKSLFAKAFASSLLNTENVVTHPDFHLYTPEGKLGIHSIEKMREFSKEVYLAPFKSDKKVFLLLDAERMLPYSANALLKTFEEPSDNTVIILVSSCPEKILPTILSRCQIIRFQPIATSVLEPELFKTHESISKTLLQVAAKISEGSFSKAHHFLEKGQFLRKFLYQKLAHGFASYPDLILFVKDLTAMVEREQCQENETAKNKKNKEEWNNLTAVQKELIEKEAEGIVAVQYHTHLKVLFEIILLWYRDLQAYHACSPSFIINQDMLDLLSLRFQRGNVPSLDKVNRLMKESMLHVQRSTPLNHVLESLFLQLL